MKGNSRGAENERAAELDAARTRLADLEWKAYSGPYKARWWLSKRRRTAEEKRLWPNKHFDELPGSSLPDGIIFEKDVPIEMSDGVKLAANVFRPDKPGKFPVIMAFTPYSKDYYGQHDPFGCSVMTPFEAPDPGFWVPSGYAMVHVDDRGNARSPGIGSGGAFDLYDGVEWAGVQNWSNGNVGMLGHSALAMRQWEVASMELPPPHLKAIIPWGGFSHADLDNRFPGGVPETEFNPERAENLPLWQRHFKPRPRPALRQYLQPPPSVLAGRIRLENIKLPMLVGVTWIDYYAHLQGTLRGWLKASSNHKWLYTYSERKWQGLYTPMEARDVQRKFFDCFLKGQKDSGILEMPRVRLSVQEKLLDYQVRYEKEFPLRRTQYKKYFLDASDGRLKLRKPGRAAKVSYDSEVSPVSQVIAPLRKVGPEGKATFRLTFIKDSEMIGYIKLKLWVAPEDTDDMDLFITLRKYDQNGHQVCFDCDAAPGRMAVALGWMRLSKRQLDQGLSTEWLPVQKSVSPEGPEQKVKPGQIVPCEIAVWPACVLFRAGERLELDISGKYGIKDDLLRGYNRTVNRGRHSVYTGGKYDSYLQVPLIPEAGQYSSYGAARVVES